MFVYIVLTGLLVLMAVMGFVQTAKLAQSHNWSVGKTRFFFVADALFAVAITVTLVIINIK